jgi:hypothetical protein
MFYQVSSEARQHLYPRPLAMSLAAALPENLFFDLVSAEEVETVHELESKGKRTSVLSYVPYVTLRFQGFHPRKLLPLSNYGTFIFPLPY